MREAECGAVVKSTRERRRREYGDRRHLFIIHLHIIHIFGDSNCNSSSLICSPSCYSKKTGKPKEYTSVWKLEMYSLFF